MEDQFLRQLLVDAKARAAKAMVKYPQPNYIITKFAEESGEATKALVHCAEGRETAETLYHELVDTFAMVYRLFIEGDQVHKLPPLNVFMASLLRETPKASSENLDLLADFKQKLVREIAYEFPSEFDDPSTKGYIRGLRRAQFMLEELAQ